MHPDAPCANRIEPLMYPHALDRYRVLQLVLRQLRLDHRPGQHEPGVGQKWVALRARVGQPTVSNLEHIAESLDSPKRHVGREELLKVLTWGFELAQERVDALLWLYDGQPLAASELRAYVRSYAPQAAIVAYTAADLRALVLAELRRFIEGDAPGELRQLAAVRLFTASPEGRLEIARASVEHEGARGQRMAIRADLSLVSHRWPRSMARDTDPFAGLAEDYDMASLGRRVALGVLQSMERYGERSIHSITALDRFLNPATPHPLTIDERLRHLDAYIDLLDQTPGWEIAFTDTTPGLELAAKSLVHAAILPGVVGHTPSVMDMDWGPAIIQFSDLRTVAWFLLLFENQWDAIAPEWKRRESVVPWLRAQYNAAATA
jgi:hypothetical protein